MGPPSRWCPTPWSGQSYVAFVATMMETAEMILLTRTVIMLIKMFFLNHGVNKAMFSMFSSSSTVCFTSSCSRNRAAVSLFWDLLCPQRLLCDPKTGRKFPLGQKHSEIGFTVSQTGDFQKEEFQDLVNVAQYTGCPMSKISSFCNALLLP